MPDADVEENREGDNKIFNGTDFFVSVRRKAVEVAVLPSWTCTAFIFTTAAGSAGAGNPFPSF